MSAFQTDAGRWVRHGQTIVLSDPRQRPPQEPPSAGEMAAWARETGAPGTTLWVQSSLNQIMGATLAVDGLLGPKTRAAIVDFQRREGLAPDGIVGPLTTAALQAALARRSPRDYVPAPSGGGTGAGAGGAIDLRGARPGLAKYARDAARYGLRVSSGLRPGAKTSSGASSYHGLGHAIDLTGSPPDMLRYAQHAAQEYGHMLEELIHTPLGAAQIKNGRPHTYSATVADDHYDHVHLADVDPTDGVVGGGGPRATRPTPALGSIPAAWGNGPVDPPPWRPTLRGYSSIMCGPRSNGMVLIPDNLQPESVPSGWTPRTQAIESLIRGPLFAWTSRIGGGADGTRQGHIEDSYHYCGRALDVSLQGVVGGEPAAGGGLRDGWRLANWASHNAAALSVSEVIFFDRIWTTARSTEGWRPYTHKKADGDPDTLQHRDHVHISVY